MCGLAALKYSDMRNALESDNNNEKLDAEQLAQLKVKWTKEVTSLLTLGSYDKDFRGAGGAAAEGRAST